MNEIIIYNNKSLNDYKSKHFYYDRRKCGLLNLQHSDLDDLQQELNLTCAELLNSQTHLKASNIKQYCRTAYENAVKRYAKQYIKNSKIKYMNLEQLLDMPEHLIHYDNEPDRDPYWKYPLLQGLTDIEQDVLFLKSDNYSYEEIERLINYEDSIAGLYKICSRARKKAKNNMGL